MAYQTDQEKAFSPKKKRQQVAMGPSIKTVKPTSSRKAKNKSKLKERFEEGLEAARAAAGAKMAIAIKKEKERTKK